MPSVAVRCPECQALLKLAAAPSGKKIKCPKCAHVFVPVAIEEEASAVTAALPKPTPRKPARADDFAQLAEDDEDEAPRKRRPRRDDRDEREEAASVRSRKAREDEEDDHDDEDERPRRRSKRRPAPKSNTGLVIALCAGVGFLLLAGGGGLVWFLMRAPNAGPNPVAVAPNGAAPPAIAPPNGVAPPVDPIANPVVAQPPAMVGDMPNDVQNKVRRATALIRVSAGSQAATGSGFLLKANGDTAYLATNHHVIALKDEEPAAQPQPGFPGPPGFPGAPKGFGPGKFGDKSKFGGPRFGNPFASGPFAQQPTRPKVETKISVILYSGTPEEQSASAEVVAIDPEADLAILRITGVRNMPEALDVTQPAPLAETMPLVIFGFPFNPAAGPGSPQVTIGKGTVGGIRRDANQEVNDVSINGQINPGNSGGPVVDVQGRLVGIAVSTVVGKEIGFAIPAAELNQMLKGRLFGGAVISFKQQGTRIDLTGEAWTLNRKGQVRGREPIAVQINDTAPGAQIPADEFLVLTRLADPLHKINAPIMLTVAAETVPNRPAADGWAPLAGAQRIDLKLRDQDAFGKFHLPPGTVADQGFAFQLSFVNAEGKTMYTQPHLVRLTFPKNLSVMTLNLNGIPNEPTRRYVEEQLPKLTNNKSTVKARTDKSLTIEIDGADDPKTVVAALPFVAVTGSRGRTYEGTLKPIDLPTPTAAEVDQAIDDLKSTDPMKQKGAADNLARVYQVLPARRVEVAKELSEHTADKDFWVRGSMLNALALWGGPENAVAISKALEIDEGMTRNKALEVLARLKQPATAPAIAKLLPNGFCRGPAAAALRAIGPPAQDAVLPYLTSPDIWAAAEASNVLRDIGDAKSVPALKALLARPNQNFMVTQSANAALKAAQARR